MSAKSKKNRRHSGRGASQMSITTPAKALPIYEKASVAQVRVQTIKAEKPGNGNDDTLDPRQRRDLLTFVNGLYTGAIGLGVAHFCVKLNSVFGKTVTIDYSKLASWDAVKEVAFAGIALISALVFILDDWRHARWVNEDYGYRINPTRTCIRYWIDCAIAITSYLLISASFGGPVQFPFCLGIIFVFGWIWATHAQIDIRNALDSTKCFPKNALKINVEKLDSIGVPQRLWYKQDYRLNFVALTHLPAGLFFIGFAVIVFASKVAGHIVGNTVFNNGETQKIVYTILSTLKSVESKAEYAPIIALCILLALKLAYHVFHILHYSKFGGLLHEQRS